MNPRSHIYKILDLVEKQEALTSTKFERVNQEKEKKSTTAQQLKDTKIALNKSEYKHGDLVIMNYLIKISKFCIEFD